MLARYTNFWQWTSFFGAYSSWGAPFGIHAQPSIVETDVWYTMKLIVQKTPFNVTAQVLDENGTLLGSHSISDSTNFTFEDIKCIALGSGWGGEFYIRNISELPPSPKFSYSPSNAATHVPIVFNASRSSDPQGPIVNYTWLFGDGVINSTDQPVIAHVFSDPGVFNVTLTVANSAGMQASTSQTVHVLQSTYLSISTDSSTAAVGSAVNVYGRLFDYYGTGLTNEPVVLSYTFAGADSWFPVTSAFTDDTGNYGMQWVNPASGAFTLKTEWQGNETYAGASSTSTLSSLPYLGQVAFFVESNSTVTALAFNSTTSELSFSVSGPSNTSGYVKATIAKSIVPNAENIKIYLDGNALNYSLTSQGDAWLLTFTYSHSTHKLSLFLGESSPELSYADMTTSPSHSETRPPSTVAALPNNTAKSAPPIDSETSTPPTSAPLAAYVALGIAVTAAAAAIVLLGLVLRKRK